MKRHQNELPKDLTTQIFFKKQHTKDTVSTLAAADSMGDLNASNDGASMALKDLRPTALASILNPLSAVVTARRFPSLLNLKRGRP